jgi:hypothetical protein
MRGKQTPFFCSSPVGLIPSSSSSTTDVPSRTVHPHAAEPPSREPSQRTVLPLSLSNARLRSSSSIGRNPRRLLHRRRKHLLLMLLLLLRVVVIPLLRLLLLLLLVMETLRRIGREERDVRRLLRHDDGRSHR